MILYGQLKLSGSFDASGEFWILKYYLSGKFFIEVSFVLPLVFTPPPSGSTAQLKNQRGLMIVRSAANAQIAGRFSTIFDLLTPISKSKTECCKRWGVYGGFFWTTDNILQSYNYLFLL